MLGTSALLALSGGLLLTVISLHGTAPPPAPLPAHSFSLAAPRAPTVSHPPAPLPPESIAIPSLHVTAPLMPSAITANELSLPGNDQIVGIYSGGAQPGAATGTVLLAGHVNTSEQGPGVLYGLVNIAPGAEIDVTGAGGILTRWSVTKLQVMLKAQLDQGIFTNQGPARLVIVTCGGPFDVATGHYIDNIVVTALPLP